MHPLAQDAPMETAARSSIGAQETAAHLANHLANSKCDLPFRRDGRALFRRWRITINGGELRFEPGASDASIG